MNKKAVIILISLLIVSQTTYLKARSGWSIFRKIFSPKAKTTAVTAVLGVRGDLSGTFYNPAVLAYNENREIFLFSEYSGDTGITGGLVYGHPLKKSSIAVGVAYYNAGQMTLNWMENGALQEKTVTSQQDILGVISYGREISKYFGAGISVKIATSKLFEKASAIAFAGDIGVVVTPGISGLTIAGALQNIGSSSKFVKEANSLPFSILGGIGYVFYFKKYKRLYISPGIDSTYMIKDKKLIPDIGLEIGYVPFSLSLGYQINDESTFNIGAIYLKKRYDIAYSYVLGVYLHSSHRISVGYRF